MGILWLSFFKFNVLDVFSQHFKVHNSVILSFKPNEMVIQTMCENDIDIKGFYTTTIPLESLEEYDFDCDVLEVNVMVTKLLIKNTSKVAGGCKSINVVSNGFLLINEEIIESLVEVSFDLYEKDIRRRKKVVNEVINEDKEDDDLLATSDEIFGRVVKRPYLHYLITSRIDYTVHRSNFRYKSIVVRNPKLLKTQYGFENRIFIAENGTLLFCGCHHYSETDVIIQAPNAVFGNYDADKEDCERFDYELPNKIFRHLFRFMGEIANKSKNVIINNFEILVRTYNESIDRLESFEFGNVSFNKLIPLSVKKQLKEDKKAKRREILERNFDKRDDWSNVKPHCHALNQHEEDLMVLPKFRINHKYYSTHVIFNDFEPLRKAEHLQLDDNDVIDKPSETRKTYDYITSMIEEYKLNGREITQDDILKKLKKLDPELYKNYLEGEVTPVFKTCL